VHFGRLKAHALVYWGDTHDAPSPSSALLRNWKMKLSYAVIARQDHQAMQRE
jgi:hypothetical protein